MQRIGCVAIAAIVMFGASQSLAQGVSSAEFEEMKQDIAALKALKLGDKSTLRAYYNNGINFATADGQFKLKLGGRAHIDFSIMDGDGQLEAAIGAAFSDVAKLTAQLVAVAKSVEGSGWGIVGWHPFDRSLVVLQCQNHEKLAIWSVVPLLVVDVWEHAYYLKYQNKRGEYLKAWTELINWGDVSERFAKASKLEG